MTQQPMHRRPTDSPDYVDTPGTTMTNPSTPPMGTSPTMAQPPIASSAPPVIVRETNDVAVAVPAPMSSRIRGGPVLGGAVVALATWVFLELLLFASGLSGLTTNVGTSSNASSWWWSAAAALVAFFIGGLVCGASTPWRHFSDGVISGLVVWAVLVVGLIVFSGLGVGIGFGAFGSVLSVGRDAVAGTPITSSAVSSAQDAAWVAAIALAATLIACVLGGAIGSKTWPGKRQTTQLQSIDMH